MSISCQKRLSDASESSSPKRPKSDKHESNSLLADAHEIAIILNIDVKNVLPKLKMKEASKRRKQLVIEDILLEKENTNDETANVKTTKESSQNKKKDIVDVLREETAMIHEMFPDKDINEIFAYLELYHDRSSRMQLAIKDLTGDTDTQTTTETIEDVPCSLDDLPSTFEELPSTLECENDDIPSEFCTKEETENDRLHKNFMKDIKLVGDIVPDCDVNFVADRLFSMSSLPDRVSKLTTELLESKIYPKLKDRVEFDEREKRKEKLKIFDMVDFLRTCPNPIEHYYDTTVDVTVSYREHCKVYFANEYPVMHSTYVEKVFLYNNYHLSSTVKKLKKQMRSYGKS